MNKSDSINIQCSICNDTQFICDDDILFCEMCGTPTKAIMTTVIQHSQNAKTCGKYDFISLAELKTFIDTRQLNDVTWYHCDVCNAYHLTKQKR